MIELYCDESGQDPFYNKNAIKNNNKYIFIGSIMIDKKDGIDIKNTINNLKKEFNLNFKAELHVG